MEIKKEIEFNKKISGFKYLKNEKLDVLLPLSKVKNNTTTKLLDVPCFYKTTSEKFVYFLPSEFLKEVNIDEILSGENGKNLKNFRGGNIHLERDGTSYVYFSFDSLKELRDSIGNKDSISNKFKEAYENYQLDITKGEKVIIVAFKNQEGFNISKAGFNAGENDFKNTNLINGSKSEFEFFSAYKFNNRYYLINKDQTIDQSSSFYLNKNANLNLNLNFLVMPYTDKDWMMCGGILDKMTDMKNQMDELFSKQYTKGQLDAPLSKSDNPLLLEMLSGSKKPKP